MCIRTAVEADSPHGVCRYVMHICYRHYALFTTQEPNYLSSPSTMHTLFLALPTWLTSRMPKLSSLSSVWSNEEIKTRHGGIGVVLRASRHATTHSGSIDSCVCHRWGRYNVVQLSPIILREFDHLISKKKPEEEDKLEDIVRTRVEYACWAFVLRME